MYKRKKKVHQVHHKIEKSTNYEVMNISNQIM